MAFKLLTFKCKKCGKEQEQLVKDEKAEDPCVECKAPATSLKQTLSVPTHGRHVSWSKWNAR